MRLDSFHLQRARSAFFLATLAPVLALTLVLSMAYYRGIRVEAKGRVEATAGELVSRMALYLNGHVSALDALARQLGLQPPDAAALERALAGFHQAYPGYLTLLAADAHGRIIATSPGSLLDSSPETSVADRDYFQFADLRPEPYVSGAFRGRGFGTDPIVAVSQGLDLAGGGRGVIEGSLDLSRLKTILEQALPEGTLYLVLDRENRVVAGNAGVDLLAPLAVAALDHWDGDAVEGERVLPGIGWTVHAARPVADIRRAGALFAGALFLGAFLCSLLGLWVFTRLIPSPNGPEATTDRD